MRDVRPGMRALAFAIVSLLSCVASAQAPLTPSVESMRENARAWGWEQRRAGDDELWCPPGAECDPPAGREFLWIRRSSAAMTVLARRHVDGWDVEASYQSELGQFGFAFTRGDERLDLSWEPSFTHGSISIAPTPAEASGGFDAWIRRELDRYLRSAASFERTAIARIDERERSARRSAAALTICPTPDAPGRFVERASGDAIGIFDTCVHRRLTDEERRAFLDHLRGEMARRRALVRRHHRAWHTSIAALLGLSSVRM